MEQSPPGLPPAQRYREPSREIATVYTGALHRLIGGKSCSIVDGSTSGQARILGGHWIMSCASAPPAPPHDHVTDPIPPRAFVKQFHSTAGFLTDTGLR